MKSEKHEHIIVPKVTKNVTEVVKDAFLVRKIKIEEYRSRL